MNVQQDLVLMKKGIVFRCVCLFNSDPNTLSVIGASSVTSDMLRFSEMKGPALRGFWSENDLFFSFRYQFNKRRGNFINLLMVKYINFK